MPETTQFGGNDDIRSEGSLNANTILVNRYRILGQLGGGGQGAVYQARDLNFSEIKRLVAIKELLYTTTDPNVRSATFKTFQREANILATLSHPAIPKIYDFFDQSGRAYLVMEYINGHDIEALMNRTKELPLDKILEWAIDMCDVLQYLHTQPEPIIFRDIKPANIMIDSLGKVRLIDFGIAKVFQTGQKHTMIGTEGYSAPEQYKGDANPLSDVYSLGATLHHILTRKDPRLEPPFSFNERPIKDFNPKVAPGFIEIIDRALQMSPKDRFQSCMEMKEALDRLRFRPSGTGAVAAANGDQGTETGFFKTGDLFGSSIEPRWKFKTEDEIRASPTAFNDLAFVGSYDHNVWAVRLSNGEFVWKYPTNAGIASSPVVADISSSTKLVLFGSEDHTFTAVDYRSGRISWSYMTKDRIRSTPRVAHDHVFFGSDDGRIYALVAGNGRYLWEYDMGAPVRTRPWVTNDFVIVGAESGEIIALELSGSRKWGHRTRRSVTASPTVDEVEGVCYVGSFDGHMYALDVSNGYSMWRFRTNGPIISSAAINEDLLFFGSTDGYLYAVNSETAKEKWRFNTEKPIVASPVVHRGSVYFGGTDGNLYCVDAKSGKELWKFPTGSGITATPYITDDILLIGSMDKTLYALPLVG